MEEYTKMSSSKRRLAQLGVAALAVVGLALGTAPAANAQIMSVALPGQEAAATGAVTGTNRNIGIAYFPIASWRFEAKGQDANGREVSNSATVNGQMLAVEATFGGQEGRNGWGLGGWYWIAGDDKIAGSELPNVFELHGKYYFTPKIGVQVGYVGFEGGDNGYDAYVTYNALSKASDPETGRGGYSLDLGLGIYAEPFEEATFDAAGNVVSTKEATETYGSAFIAGSYDVANRISINTSIWIVASDEITATRFALGGGYRF